MIGWLGAIGQAIDDIPGAWFVYGGVILLLLHVTGVYPFGLFVTDTLGVIWGIINAFVQAVADAIIDAANPLSTGGWSA